MIDHEKNPVLGIDLGTTFSAIARWDGRGPRPYHLKHGQYDLQSAVYFDPKTKQFIVGSLAYNRGMVSPENLAVGIKRNMDDGESKIKIGGQEFTPIELSSKILESLYNQIVEMFPKGLFKPRGTIVTVPYYFKAHQCANTRKAADLANIECIGVLPEPIAASLSYAWQLVQDHPGQESEENILVFDLGGGTFDLTLFKLTRTKKLMTFEVLATGGDDRLGGMDFDECLIKLLLDKSGISLEGLSDSELRKARQKLISPAKEAKEALSSVLSYNVSVPFVLADKSIDIEVTREEFAKTLTPYVERIENIIEAIWAVSGKRKEEVQRVIRVGGSSLIPRMNQLLGELIGAEKIYTDPEPTLAVVKGAAIYAAHQFDSTILGHQIEIITRTCHGLGVEVDGGLFDIVIPANRKAPCTAESLFVTATDNQEGLDINVYQGSKPYVKDNTKIGTVEVRDLPPRPKGKLEVEIKFEVSSDQNLTVTVNVMEEGTRKLLKSEIGAFTYA